MGVSAILHAAQAALSAYGLYYSYQCITKLRQYEERSKKAAKYSNTAADQLHRTRTTQASAAIAVSLPAHPSARQPFPLPHFCSGCRISFCKSKKPIIRGNKAFRLF